MDIGASIDWDSFVETLGPKLYRYFCSRFEDVVADDLTQETLVRLVDKFNKGHFDDSKGTMEMYAFGIARFVRLEELKEKSHSLSSEGLVDAFPDENNLVENFEKTSEINLLKRGIAALGEPQQEIILLMVDKEWNLNDIAKHMGMPLGTIKSHVHRAKKNIFEFVSVKKGVSYGR